MHKQDVEGYISRDIYSVGRLNSEVRAVLEGSFPLIWIEGEVSNLARPASGHLYFSLKDAQAQVRCALFRMQRRRLRLQPENGQQVLLRARVSLYEGRGEFQLIVENLEAAGEGALRQSFEALKQRLASEGLFATEHKRPLPRFPTRIGIITSPSGAAIRDVLSVLARRFPAIPAVVYPVPVQGDEAPQAIADMIQTANRRGDCDLLILTRGGGSLEDLMAFNDERVARAIYGSGIPLVSAVGHEVDFSIADFVADQRAPTPSAAAELVTPDQVDLQQSLRQLEQRLRRRIMQMLDAVGDRLRHLTIRLQQQQPGARLLQWAQRLDEVEQRLHYLIGHRLHYQQQWLDGLDARLRSRTPSLRLLQAQGQCRLLGQRLRRAIDGSILGDRQRLAAQAASLNALSPLATLERGYSITRHLPDGKVVVDASQVNIDDDLETLLAHGRLICRVHAIAPAD